MGRICRADGCWKQLVGRPDKVWCSVTCRKRQQGRDRRSNREPRDCAYCGKPMGRVHGRRRYCDDICLSRSRRLTEEEEPLSPYWVEYLRLFDIALFARTEEAWDACHALAPEPERIEPIHRTPMAEALRILLPD